VAAIDPDEEFEAASRLARKRAPRLAGLERTVQQRRLAGVLARYGFPSSVVHRAVDQVLAELAVDGVLPDGAAVSGAGNGTAWR
jgi:regulatory protein